MHTCLPPTDALDKWLEAYGTVEQKYGHLLLEQKGKSDQDVVDALRPYFESAHLDAREYFHAQIGISLHPDAAGELSPVRYPNCLPSKAHRGLFGEVVAGLVTQAYQDEFVGVHEWRVPIFLFVSTTTSKIIYGLSDSIRRERARYGRHGSDFIGVALNGKGEVSRMIAGEAKWRASLTNSVVKGLLFGPKERDEDTGEMVHNGRGIWFEVNRDTPIPHGLRQLQKLLEQRDPEGHANAILSIDRAVLGQGPLPGRTNLVLLVGNGAKRREALSCLIPWEQAPAEYTARHDLQVVEIILEGGDALIDKLYASLWHAP